MSSRTRTRKTTRTRPANPAAPKATLPTRTPTEPEFITEQQMAAAYAANLAGLPRIPIRAWTHNPDDTLTAHFPTGARLTYTPADQTFTGITPCANGAHHQTPIHTGADLHHAETDAGTCQSPHGHLRVDHLTEGLHRATASAADTQTLDVTDLRNQHKEQPADD